MLGPTGRWSAVTLATVLAIALALRWTTPSDAQDLRPRPDALEYESAARNLVRGLGYCVTVDGHRYPPRYPFGFSALLTPLLWTWDAGPGTGVLVVVASALLATSVTWGAGLMVGGVASAATAALLLAVSPAHVRASRMVMADVPASCAVGVVMLGALALLDRRTSAGRWCVLGVTVGLAATIRPTNLLLLVPILAMLCARSVPTRRTAAAAAVAGGTAIALLPLATYDAMHFGSPLASGYSLWAPGAYFSWLYVLGVPKGGGTDGNAVYYLRALGGDGTLYPWPVGVLVALGTIEALRAGGAERRFCVLALGFLLLLTGFHLVFFWQASRFLLPALPPVFVLAAVPFSARAPRPVQGAAALLGAMTAFALLRAPGSYAGGVRYQEADSLRAIARRVEPNAAVLVRTNDQFFESLLRCDGADRVWVPIGLDEHQLAVRWFHIAAEGVAPAGDAWIDHTLEAPFDPDRTEQMVRRMQRAGRPVYLSMLFELQEPLVRKVLETLQSRFLVDTVKLPSPATWALARIGDPRGPGLATRP